MEARTQTEIRVEVVLNVRISGAAGSTGAIADTKGKIRAGAQTTSIIGIGAAELGEVGADLARTGSLETKASQREQSTDIMSDRDAITTHHT